MTLKHSPLTELMHAVLDGEASNAEARELETRLAADGRGSGDPARGHAQPGRAVRSDVDARRRHGGRAPGAARRAFVGLAARCRRRELVLEVSSDIRHVRIPVGLGLVGACARDRQVLNVPDCYADPRFDQQSIAARATVPAAV
jgi:hypothetical protein